MGSHETAINTFLENGLRNRQLDSILASNCVMDWFGRTFVGQHRVITFYLNSNAVYEHSLTNVETCEAFEDRPNHIHTREQPLENLKGSPDLAGDEQWFDCETHSPVNLKESHRTPLHRSSPPHCPPAPCRVGRIFLPQSDSEEDDYDDMKKDSDFGFSDVRPLDGESTLEQQEKSPDTKRLKIGDETIVEASTPQESRFSELYYLETTGTVTINRQPATSDEAEKRDCKLFLSYRVLKDDPSVIQIALIVYKSNSSTKSRRNLMHAFDQRESVSQASTNIPSSSRSRSAVKDRRRIATPSTVLEISTEPSGSKFSKANKRPMNSKTSLRF